MVESGLAVGRRLGEAQRMLRSGGDPNEHDVCRLQRPSLFAYLTDLLSANIRGDPIPALT